MKELFISIRILVILSILTGIIYPLLITLGGQALWPYQAFGSLIKLDDKIIGSKLLAQKFTQAKYFHGRPSATDYATVPSGASNLSPTSMALSERIQKSKDILGPDTPTELLTTSASGLDPHLSPEASLAQLERVSRARDFSPSEKARLKQLIEDLTEYPALGFIGKKVVNVLKLNLALDEATNDL